jgi:small neutral amino acid transporter SnatA (MarC family)
MGLIVLAIGVEMIVHGVVEHGAVVGVGLSHR